MDLRHGRAEDARLDAEGLRQVDAAVEDAIAARVFPGAVAAVARGGILAHLNPHGRFTYDETSSAVRADTRYDLASLTKVIGTTTAAMVLVDEGRLDLDRPASAYVRGFRGGARDRVTVRHLLAHASGLPAWQPLFQSASGAGVLDLVLHADLEYEPGTRSVYSDLGFILLGAVLSEAGAGDLGTFVASRVLEPFGLAATGYRPPAGLRSLIAPTEDDPWRGRVLVGEVHDENACALGGVAPHAGLFGIAEDVARFGHALLEGGRAQDRQVVRAETVALFTRRAGIPGSSRGLGWDTPAEGSSAGVLLSPRSFGHTGFTGTSLWCDPDRGLVVVLLSNRVHPTRNGTGITEARRAVADAAARAADAG